MPRETGTLTISQKRTVTPSRPASAEELIERRNRVAEERAVLLATAEKLGAELHAMDRRIMAPDTVPPE